MSLKEMLQVNCDGEPVKAKDFSFSILPSRLRLHVPHAPLLSKQRPERQRLSHLWEDQARRERWSGLEKWRMQPMPGALCCLRPHMRSLPRQRQPSLRQHGSSCVSRLRVLAC